jgi:acyl-CoA synthetase (AMP-forming)/AMP-acid ligase II
MPKLGKTVSKENLAEHLRERLANYKIPKLLVMRDHLPMLPIGKLDKQQLRAQAAELWRATLAHSR